MEGDVLLKPKRGKKGVRHGTGAVAGNLALAQAAQVLDLSER